MNLKKGYISDSKLKLALSICLGPGTVSCFKCPYFARGCLQHMSADALNYIVRLEWKVEEYEKQNKS